MPAVGRAAQTAREVGEKAASAVRGATKESDVAPAPSAVDEGISPVAAPASRNVAGPAPTGLTSPKSSSVSVPRVKNPKATPASLPKVSETINSSSKNVVAAILKANKQLDAAAKGAREIAAEVAPAARSSKAAPQPSGVVEFARDFFKLADDTKPLGQMRAPGGGPVSNIFPANGPAIPVVISSTRSPSSAP